jgi:hypothetical protein
MPEHIALESNQSGVMASCGNEVRGDSGKRNQAQADRDDKRSLIGLKRSFEIHGLHSRFSRSHSCIGESAEWRKRSSSAT